MGASFILSAETDEFAKSEGYKACMNYKNELSKPFPDNPYQNGSVKYASWVEGCLQGDEESGSQSYPIGQ